MRSTTLAERLIILLAILATMYYIGNGDGYGYGNGDGYGYGDDDGYGYGYGNGNGYGNGSVRSNKRKRPS